MDIDAHIGQHMLDRLEAVDRLAESLPLSGKGYGFFQRLGSHAHRIGTDRKPSLVQALHGIAECLALLSQQAVRSEEHTSELQSLMRISYAVFCLNKKKTKKTIPTQTDYRQNKNTTNI